MRVFKNIDGILKLSDFNFSTGFFQFSGQIISFCFRYTGFNCFRSAVNQFFSLFQTKTSQIFNGFNYVQFRSTCIFQDYIECSFFFSCSSTFAGWSHYHCSSSWFDTVLCFQHISKFLNFFNG